MKHLELQQELINIIQHDQSILTQGRFLSERDICERFHVSRTTVRKAISDLCEQGYLIRKHGKGTFLKRPEQSMPLDTIMHMAQTYTEMGYHPKARVLHKRSVPANPTVAEHLQIEPGELVLTVEKLYYADRHLLNDVISFYPLQRFPKIANTDFNKKNPMEAFRDYYGITYETTYNTFEAIHAPQEIAKSLNISTKTPILLFESVSRAFIDNEEIPVSYYRCYYKTNRFRFSYTLETMF